MTFEKPKPLLWDYMRFNAETRGNEVALVFGGHTRTYGDLERDALAMAASLARLGVGPEDAVSYQLPNWPEALVILLAAWRIGAVANPIIPILRRHEVGFIVSEMKSRVLFIPREFRGFDYPEMVDRLELADEPEVFLCGAADAANSYEKLLAEGRKLEPPPCAGDPDADAVVIYTSGTSGNPKGVRHCQRRLLFEAMSYVNYSDVDADAVNLVVSPLGHITGLCHVHLIPQILGAKMCMMDHWDAAAAIEIIEREKCTWMGGATPFLQMLLDALNANPDRIPTLKVFRCGGADVPPDLIRQAHARGIEAVRCYGSTEHPTISGACGGPVEKAACTDGWIHDHVEIRIVDIGDETRRLPVGEQGEIQSRGTELFLGYSNSDLDSEAFSPDGWFRTGDLGFVDEDNYITITGRKKEIIIRKGENISAREVEEAVAGHPAVAQVAVIGLADQSRGEMVVAVCVLKDGQSLSLAGLVAYLDDYGLAKQKYPERLELVSEMPTTASGKIRKPELKSRFSRSQ